MTIVITEYNGKVFGSQFHISPHNNALTIMVYYEVPLGQREEVKMKFNDFVLSIKPRTN